MEDGSLDGFDLENSDLDEILANGSNGNGDQQLVDLNYLQQDDGGGANGDGGASASNYNPPQITHSLLTIPPGNSQVRFYFAYI